MPEDRNRAQLELLMGISREVAAALDLRTVLQRLLFATLKNVGGERGSIIVLDGMGNPVDATIVFGGQFHENTTQQMRDTVERGLAGWVVSHRKAALVTDTSKDDRWLHRVDDGSEKSVAKSALCVPLSAREQLVGVLTLVDSKPNIFSSEHLELAQAIADQAGVAVLNARLYTESQRTARVMSALAEGAAAINTSLEMPEVWRRILNQTMQALQVETVGLALLEPTGGDPAHSSGTGSEPVPHLVFLASAGQNAGNILGRHVPTGAGLAGIVAQDGQGLIVPNVSQDKRYGEADQFVGIKIRAVAIAPIQSQGKVIGVLEAINPISGAFDPDAMLVMTGLGSLAGTTIQNARFLEQLQVTHQRYRELFEESNDPILVTDWGGRILEANRQAARLTGYGAEQLRRMRIGELHQVDWEITGQEFNRLREREQCAYESLLLRADGGTTPVEIHARRFEFEETDSLQWILRDITERNELDVLREDMTAMIYHDLRSPLGNIVSSLELLGSMLPKDETVQSILGIANHSTARLQRMLTSLLDINRLEAGQRIEDQNAVHPEELLEQAIRDERAAAEGRQQKIEMQLPENLPLIWVDVDMIYRVLINLIENAIKFSPVQSQINIGAQEDGPFVKMWIRDNGPGIPAADQEHIFDKFTRLRGKTQSGGLGVGLAFCRLAIQGHGGEIHVESEIEKGTTFWFTLPAASMKQTGKLVRHQNGRLRISEE
jgi:NtrC-family two-component system sensor histidine kinase KinB